MRILVSSLACSPHYGSESLVGFKTVQALAEQYALTLITSTAMIGPPDVPIRSVAVRFDEPNDVAPGQLMRYEKMQARVVRQMMREQKFDLFHRVNPSGYKDSLLPVPSIPLVLGPVLGSEPPPPAFELIFRPQVSRTYSRRALLARVRNGIARRSFARRSTLNLLLDHAALILVGTQVTLRRLPTHVRSKCRWLPYAGVEHDVFLPPARARGNKLPQLLFVGRIVPYKGVELLLRAAAAASNRCKFELKIVGGGYSPYVRYCKQLVTRLNLGESVVFLGAQPRDALVRFYQTADIFCMPSIETYGIAILEAMSCGRAVIVSDINGPGEIVQDGAGLKVPLTSPRAVRRRICRTNRTGCGGCETQRPSRRAR